MAGRVVIPGSAGVPPAQDLAVAWLQGLVALPAGGFLRANARAPRGKPMAGQGRSEFCKRLNQKSCPCSARGPSYPPPPLGGEEPFFLLVFLRVPSWSFVPLRGYLFVLCAPSWIEYRRFLPLVRNESLLLPPLHRESLELLLDFRLGGVAGVDVDPVEEAEGLSLG